MRLAFVVATAAGGFGLGAYLLGWILIPPGDPGPARSRLPPAAPPWRWRLAPGLLLLAVLLTFRALGIWFSDAVVWPLVLIAGGGALLWRQSLGSAEPAPVEAAHAHSRPPPDADANARLAAAKAAARRRRSRGPASALRS